MFSRIEDYSVPVREYDRFRNGMWEHVRSHFRRPPVRGRK